MADYPQEEGCGTAAAASISFVPAIDHIIILGVHG
jgi:hypothetical protein